ncbi:putative monooxygenase [Talaromyces proteolyticus]|uniref:Monooxygenase n=1 Tax=Talaromyces proteolyticus TaxID=1131652 RepID=A0AAD4Q0J0_9EURO|nr:putative monooxygenase [Talaromyces proteolyticus]KAH8700879.1 putative monooxygenase [Talaromyces proteolyticus]
MVESTDPTESECETTAILICGCGPTGAMLSAYLGQMSIPNIVLEQEADITTDPRGIALDEDGIRLMQGLGVYEEIYTEIGTCMHLFKFVDGSAYDLSRQAFLEMDYATTEGGTGHVGFICHKQPALEKTLRSKMAANGFSELRSRCSVTGLREDENWTYCEYTDSSGATRRVRSKFFVGADGKTGYTRKKYLESRGVYMERAHNAFYEETWVALNWKISLPTKATHPDFPLWALGYTAEEVYDLFFPVNFRFLCNPARPAVCGRFGPPADRLWRFEFVVRRDERGEEMAEPKMVKKIVFPYLKHPGRRYGLAQDVQFPEDCIQVLRSRPFMFSARSCNKWSEGRVILCGDAAHVFPPFGGQGIASGFRDASSLAWRLAFLCNPSRSPSISHSSILTAWYLERKQQLEKSLATTIENGRFVTETNPLKIFIRNWSLWLMQLIPSWRHELRLGRRKEGMVRYQQDAGNTPFPFLAQLNGGLCVSQVYYGVVFSDDAIFGGKKKGLFQLLVYLKDDRELTGAMADIAGVETLARGWLKDADVTIVLEREGGYQVDERWKGRSVYTLASGEEFARSRLCNGRPEPQFYDPYRLGKELKGNRYTIIRPDRFVFASCSKREELQTAVEGMVAYLTRGELN